MELQKTLNNVIFSAPVFENSFVTSSTPGYSKMLDDVRYRQVYMKCSIWTFLGPLGCDVQQISDVEEIRGQPCTVHS